MLQKQISLICLMVVMASFIEEPSIFMGRILSLCGIITVGYPLIRSIKSYDFHIFILFAFIISYILIPFNYFWFGKHVASYTMVERLSNVYKVLQIICIFHCVLLYYLKFSMNKSIHDKPPIENCPSIFRLLVILSLIFTTFGATGQTIFSSGGYSETLENKSSSSLFAYSLIPTSLSFLYANTKKKKRVSYFLTAYFCLKNLAYGGRVETLQLFLILYFIKYQYEWSVKKMIILAGMGAFFMITWGFYRIEANANLIQLYVNVAMDYFTRDSTIDFQVGHSSEVYYSSIRIIYLIEENILTTGLRMQAALFFVLSVFVPYSLLPDVANLSSFMQNDFYSGGGGLAPVFLYAFGGYIGVIVFGVFVAKCINLFIKAKASKYTHFYAVLLLATTPRWYGYYPIQILKFCLIGALLYYLLDVYLGRVKRASEMRTKNLN